MSEEKMNQGLRINVVQVTNSETTKGIKSNLKEKAHLRDRVGADILWRNWHPSMLIAGLPLLTMIMCVFPSKNQPFHHCIHVT